MRSSLLSCRPLFETPRSANRPTRGDLVAKVALGLGQPLMPWQQQVADVANEILPDGTPAYREIIVTVPRQQGKTTWVLAQEIERCGFRGKQSTVAYSAQTGADARKKFLEDQAPLIDPKSKRATPLKTLVQTIGRTNGNEFALFKNGSRINVTSSSSSAGHGKTIDLGVIDEAFDDIDDRREQAFLPAMVTKTDAQLIVVSTMGTDASVYLNRKIDLGRAAAQEGRTSGIAYFEWAIPEGEDIEDPRSWWMGMPALGHTITEAVVAHARTTMTEGEFRRAFGNQRTRSAERVIPEVTWRTVCGDHTATDPKVYALDVSPDRDWGALAVAGGGVVELGDYRPGVGWIVGRCKELHTTQQATFAIDAAGPAGALIPDLRAVGVPVVEIPPADVTKACGGFYDAVADATVRIRTDLRLDAAVEAVTRRPVGDAWRWGRRGTVDVTALMAVTLAWFAPTPGGFWMY